MTTNKWRCNGERVSTPPDPPRPADLHQLAAAQTAFTGELVALTERHEDGDITRNEMKLLLEEACIAADEIRKALLVLTGAP